MGECGRYTRTNVEVFKEGREAHRDAGDAVAQHHAQDGDEVLRRPPGLRAHHKQQRVAQEHPRAAANA